MQRIVLIDYVTFHSSLPHFVVELTSTELLQAVLVEKLKQSVASVCPSVRLIVSTLFFGPTDLWTLVCMCG